ncbi:9b62904b-2b6b-4794-b569-199149b66b40 [Thermothielavioides terrestris]|uniref:9b62904b-2b6b-4794-b569-199149b66b40 n=1 Tax=Thermothielavioides terrestris TaxID=2587410 RepID=A0A3S4CC16_9PEZI|nr:9b62904b-2b6b-4794-b569-199149b66b40 [Thermothielavioides terrestris]
MDLEQAAVADRERRARLQEDEAVTVSRSVAQSRGMAPEDVMKRAVSLKRKEVASGRESVFPGALQPESVTVASTTSLQLSPGGDDTRRRSPRPSLQEDSMQLRPASPPVQAPEPVKAPSDSPQTRPLTVLQPLLRTDIRPSRMLPPSPKAPPPEPTKTPLQRRPTIGLPTNPRARGLKIADESGSQHRTILFLNNIEYNDPLTVEAIIKGAGNNVPKPRPVAETLDRTTSVINRPRPVPRKPAESPAQASPSPGHRRSKSGGSLVGRKSLIAQSPGSPTQLPPLPSLPRSATVSSRPQPNDTKSMTFDEKLKFFFPSPPSASAPKRRSSVPEVPRIPLSYLDADSSPSEVPDKQGSDRTTKASMRTESSFEVNEIPRPLEKASVSTANGALSPWLRGRGGEEDDGRPKNRPSATQSGGKRGSSPIIPEVAVRASAWTETTYDRSEEDTSNWSAIASLELAVGIPVVQKGLPAAIQLRTRQDARGSELFSLADSRSSDILPIMLEAPTVERTEAQGSLHPETEPAATPERATWHRRVGDECPTFSDRKEKARSRKMAPPAPLALNGPATKTTVAIQVEPSPLESPAQALQQIRAQLRKLEQFEQASPQSASRRQALLEDLEREMGQQAEHWQEIKHDIGRDSMSSMQTASRRESTASTVNLSVSESSHRQSIGAERRASRISRMRDNAQPKVPGASVRNSASPQLSTWQKRLTEAQMDYMDAQRLRGSTVNFMQLTRAKLASPTPPDSDDSDQSDPEMPPLQSVQRIEPVAKQSPIAQSKTVLLWAPKPKEPAARSQLLWSPPSKPVLEPEPPLPGLSVRPSPRKEWAPLQIESSHLWRKPHNTAHRPAEGLWRPVWASSAPPAQPVTRATSKSTTPSPRPPRPVTQRPPRRNKRVTLLPDILESPEPLPDKRGTLGIFQFPWGEKSDTASIQPRPSMYMAMPGTMASGGPSLGASSRQTEPTEYSSSFFDDYDDENDDAETDSDGDDSDDGFDETTLWEIASLLKTDTVPSRDSLLPPPSESVVDDYIDELASDNQAQSPRQQSIIIGLAEPQELLREQQRDSATIESSTLLMLEDTPESKTPSSKPAARTGLPANPKAALNAQGIRTAKPAVADAPPRPGMSQMPARTVEVQGAETTHQQGLSGLWNPPLRADQSSPRRGLFVPGSRRSDYRGTSEEPAAKDISRKPRAAEQKPLDILTSTQLWTLGHSKLTSYPRTKDHARITASPAEWKAALQEAITLSARSSRPRPAVDPAVRHPVFAASSLITRSEWFHPAATGYTYNVAAVHPVFFGSLAITCPEEAVHPAISAYAAKKLRRQRSRQRTLERSDSRSRSSSRGRRKEETHALEKQQQGGSQSYVSSDMPPPVPAEISRRDPIQAQIEALEQERLFVERAAKAEYRRRTSMAAPTPIGGEHSAQEFHQLEAEVMPAAAATVQDLQRHLSQQIRQSLVFSAAAKPVPVPAPESVSESSPEPSAKAPSTASSPSHRSSGRRPQPSASQSPVHDDEGPKDAPRLWTPPPPPSSRSVPAGPSSTTGLWTTANRRDHSASPDAWAEEDGEAVAQRRRRRRVVQKRRRRAEIRAQIAAVEQGLNPFVDFAGMALWNSEIRPGQTESALAGACLPCGSRHLPTVTEVSGPFV